MARTKLTLQDVARAASDRNGGKGGRALQRIAKSKGLTLSYATVDRILAGKYESTPQRQTIEALAVLAEMPLDEVYAAAGLPLPMASLAEQLPDGSDNLSTHQRRVVLDVIRGFIRDNDRMAELEHQRDARPLPQHELLRWVRETDPSSFASMDFDELYDMVQYMSISAPAADEREEVFRAFSEASRVLEDRQQAYMAQERRDEEVERGEVARDAQPDGVMPPAGGRRPRQEDYGRAADASGPSLLEADDARAAARGEESQDPGSDEPA